MYIHTRMELTYPSIVFSILWLLTSKKRWNLIKIKCNFYAGFNFPYSFPLNIPHFAIHFQSAPLPPLLLIIGRQSPCIRLLNHLFRLRASKPPNSVLWLHCLPIGLCVLGPGEHYLQKVFLVFSMHEGGPLKSKDTFSEQRFHSFCVKLFIFTNI
jgi:hypothetical protein